MDEFIAKIEHRIAEVQRKLDEVGKRVDASAAHIDDIVDKKMAKAPKRTDRIFWGIFLILLGALWFGNSAGWYNVNVSWWPIVIIAFGAYLMLGGR